MRAIADAARWRASAHLPVFAGGAPAGFLAFHYEAERAFDDEERAFLSAIAGQCSQALERARLYEAERDLRTAAEEARGRAELLADVCIALGERHGASKRTEPLVATVVPRLADVAMVVERAGDGALRAAAVARDGGGDAPPSG